MPNWLINDPPVTHLSTVQIANIGDLSAILDEANLHWLSDNELARYQTMTSTNRKQQFLAGHFLVRKIASQVHNNAFEDWTYFHDENNQRRLKCRQSELPEFYISISHSGKKIAAAISFHPIGIDLETYDKQRDFIAIANHVFSAIEVAYLKTCKHEELKPNFYLHWTLKESIAKQHGEGLKFEVSRVQTSIAISDSEHASMQSWQCSDYVLSVACNRLSDIIVNGICNGAVHRRWKNISSISR